MPMMNLKNGSCEVEGLVFTIVSTIGVMLDAEEDIAVYDLVKLSEDPEYPVSKVSMEKLKLWGMVDSHGRVVGSVRNVVLSSCKIGDDLIFRMGDPSLTEPASAAQ